MPKKATTNDSAGSVASNGAGKVLVTAASPLTLNGQYFNKPGAMAGPVSGQRANQVQPLHPAGSTTNKPAAPMGCWDNTQRTSTVKGLMASSIMIKNAKSMAGSLVPSRAGNDPSALTAGIGNMSLNGAPSVWNPSIGPTPSKVDMMSMAAWRARVVPQSRAGSNVSVRQPFFNSVCRASNYTREHFKRGDIIAIPFHTPNTNPHVDPVRDDAWQMTIWGPIYSKRRMVIVLWIHERDMFCLTLYTFEKTGLRQKGRHIMHEYVSVKHVGKPHINQGIYPAIEVQAYKKDMDADSTVHLTGGMRVGCNEDITWAGRVTKQSYNQLVALWQKLSMDARAEPWQD